MCDLVAVVHVPQKSQFKGILNSSEESFTVEGSLETSKPGSLFLYHMVVIIWPITSPLRGLIDPLRQYSDVMDKLQACNA